MTVLVREIALNVIKTCLIEDTGLFLRYYLERITVLEKHATLLAQLRKVVMTLPELPPQAAHALFNYLVRFLSFRTPSNFVHKEVWTFEFARGFDNTFS